MLKQLQYAGDSRPAGFVTEYSGVRYLVFFMVEWGNLYIIGALATTLFLGGWQIPAFFGDGALATLLQFVTFFLKSYFWVLVAMWIRATLPRPDDAADALAVAICLAHSGLEARQALTA